jgi:hypothetical protein
MKYSVYTVTSKGNIRSKGVMDMEEVTHAFLTNTGKPMRGTKMVILMEPADLTLTVANHNKLNKEERINALIFNSIQYFESISN